MFWPPDLDFCYWARCWVWSRDRRKTSTFVFILVPSVLWSRAWRMRKILFEFWRILTTLKFNISRTTEGKEINDPILVIWDSLFSSNHKMESFYFIFNFGLTTLSKDFSNFWHKDLSSWLGWNDEAKFLKNSTNGWNVLNLAEKCSQIGWLATPVGDLKQP